MTISPKNAPGRPGPFGQVQVKGYGHATYAYHIAAGDQTYFSQIFWHVSSGQSGGGPDVVVVVESQWQSQSGGKIN